MVNKRKYGYGSTDFYTNGPGYYIGKKRPPGVKKGTRTLRFTKDGFFYLENNKTKKYTCVRWGGNRAGRNTIRKEFLKNPTKMWKWIGGVCKK